MKIFINSLIAMSSLLIFFIFADIVCNSKKENNLEEKIEIIEKEEINIRPLNWYYKNNINIIAKDMNELKTKILDQDIILLNQLSNITYFLESPVSLCIDIIENRKSKKYKEFQIPTKNRTLNINLNIKRIIDKIKTRKINYISYLTCKEFGIEIIYQNFKKRKNNLFCDIIIKNFGKKIYEICLCDTLFLYQYSTNYINIPVTILIPRNIIPEGIDENMQICIKDIEIICVQKEKEEIIKKACTIDFDFNLTNGRNTRIWIMLYPDNEIYADKKSGWGHVDDLIEELLFELEKK